MADRMPLPVLLSIVLSSISIVLLEIFQTEEQNDNQQSVPPPPTSEAIGPQPAKDKYAEIRGTVWWSHYCGLSEDIFDDIEIRLSPRLYEARNIHFEYSRLENMSRNQRPCKISNRNRILNFLRQMRTGQILWDSAREHGWNRWSAMVDFYHTLWHFVDEFEDEVIAPMSANVTNSMRGNWPYYPTAVQALDGCQFLCLRSGRLPPGMRRRDYFCWKKKHPEGRNVQATVNQFGICTELLVGPGGMNDAAMSTMMCLNDAPGSTLVDDGYSQNRVQFIIPDGTEEHSAARSVVERYFGRVKVLWRMVGGVWTKYNKDYFDLVIRAAFILTNLKILESNGLNAI